MAIHLFLILIGSILGCSIALLIAVKSLSEGFAVSGKKPLVYGSFSAVLISLAGHAASYISNNPFRVFWYLGAIFLLAGIVHIAFIHKRYFYAHRNNSNQVLRAELIFSFSVVLFTLAVFSSLQYFLKDKGFLFYPLLMSSLLFFVPLLVYHAFGAAYDIPPTVFPTWEYPLHNPIELPDPEDTAGEKIVVIGFEIAKRTGDHRKTYFRAKGPETMKLGEFFYHFMNEYNEHYSETAIEYTSPSYEPYEWWFQRKPKWYQAQVIYDPHLTVRENRIGENTIIVCERVQQPAFMAT